MSENAYSAIPHTHQQHPTHAHPQAYTHTHSRHDKDIKIKKNLKKIFPKAQKEHTHIAKHKQHTSVLYNSSATLCIIF